MDPRTQYPQQPEQQPGQSSAVQSGQPVYIPPSGPLPPLEPPFGADQQSSGYVPTAIPPKRKRWVLPTLLVGLMLLLCGVVYGLAVYLPNRPSAAYETALENTGKAMDSLMGYAGSVASKQHTSYDIAGDISSQGDVGVRAKFTGTFDRTATANIQAQATIAGANLTADIRSVPSSKNAAPDIYVRVNGVKDAGSITGVTYFDSLNDQWLTVDHQLMQKLVSSMSDGRVADISQLPTSAELTDAANRFQKVNKQYLFTTDTQYAVLKDPHYISQETQDGRQTYHYVVGYDKAHLTAYLTALQATLNDSSLNAWARSAYNGKSIGQVLALDALKKDLSKASSAYTIDVWIDKEMQIIHTVHMTDPANKHASFTLTQNYTGGTSYPFSLTVQQADGRTNIMKVTLDTKTDKQTAQVITERGSAKATYAFTVTPSNKKLQVSVPEKAESISGILDLLGVQVDDTQKTTKVTATPAAQ